jgi:DNA-binding GntR family transcriptional regulator
MAKQPENAEASAGVPEDVEQAIEHIRKLNEQVLDNGRRLGIEFLDAYEKTLQTFADFQEQIAQSAGSDWVADIARAQAQFIRTVGDAYTKGAREMLK